MGGITKTSLIHGEKFKTIMSAMLTYIVIMAMTNLMAQIGSGLYLQEAQSCRLSLTLFRCKVNILVTLLVLHGSMEIIHQVKMKALSNKKYVSPLIEINAIVQHFTLIWPNANQDM